MQQAAQTAVEPLRVFLVEDSSLVRERLERMLSALAGTRTVGYASGAQAAIRAILAEQPDIVVLDLKLAQGSGFDVLRAVREQAPAIEIYMLTNFSSEPYRRLAERLGAREFFDKTREFERVRDIVAARAASRH
jgi:two-component system, NarL family, response regulator DevR